MDSSETSPASKRWRSEGIFIAIAVLSSLALPEDFGIEVAGVEFSGHGLVLPAVGVAVALVVFVRFLRRDERPFDQLAELGAEAGTEAAVSAPELTNPAPEAPPPPRSA